MKKNIVFYYPSKAIGGAEFLFYRLALNLSVKNFLNVYYVDFSDGFISCKLKSNSEIKLIQPEDLNIIPKDSVIISVSTLLSDLKKAPLSARILCWNIHPDNMIWMRNNLMLRNSQLKKYIKMLKKSNSLYSMDKACEDSIKNIIGCSDNKYLPVGMDLSSYSFLPRSSKNNKEINICWLGRLDGDKIWSLINLLENFSKYKTNKKKVLHIIGDGNSKSEINISKYQNNIEIRFCGYLFNEDLDLYIKSKIDIMFAMGTSMLESAKLSIPTLLCPFSMEPFSVNKYIYLKDLSDYILGLNLSDFDKNIYLAKSINEILTELNEEKIYKNNAKECFEYCIKKHSISNTANKLISFIDNVGFSVKNLIELENKFKMGGDKKMNLGQIIIDKIRYAFRDIEYIKFYKFIKNYQKDSNKEIVLFATTYSMLTSMKQRLEHILKKFAEDENIVIIPDLHISKPFELENKMWFVPDKYLHKLLKQKKIKMIIFSMSTHYTLKNVSKYFNNSINNGNIVIYEHLDDFDLIKMPKLKRELKQEFKKICINSKIVISTTADNLYEEAKEYRGSGENIVILKNAVNFEDFNRQKIKEPPIGLAEIVKKNKPIIGYYGVIVDDWFDCDLIINVAKKCPQYEFVFIGPKGGDETEKMFEESNVNYIPKIRYEDIPLYANFFSIATIPFKLNEITQSTSPVKLFEYMALGLPIITTPITECLKYKSCLIAKDVCEYSQQIEKALILKKDTRYQKILETDALNNTWDKRYNLIINLVNKIRLKSK